MSVDWEVVFRQYMRDSITVNGSKLLATPANGTPRVAAKWLGTWSTMSTTTAFVVLNVVGSPRGAHAPFVPVYMTTLVFSKDRTLAWGIATQWDELVLDTTVIDQGGTRYPIYAPSTFQGLGQIPGPDDTIEGFQAIHRLVVRR